MDRKRIQLSMLIDSTNHTKDHKMIFKEVKEIYQHHFGTENFTKVDQTYMIVISLFKGEFSGYRACNTEYHDLGHTMDTLMATARLMDGWIIEKKETDHNQAKNMLIAALLHDTGYIQEENDVYGTGAKHTKIHVQRSMDFVERHAHRFNLDSEEVKHIQNYIEYTSLNSNFTEDKPDVHYTAGTILGAGDLLGQMSDRAYLEKLLFLYYEFQEAGFEGYNTEFDILKNTISFYDFTMQRLEYNLKTSYKFARIHFRERYGIDENLYITAIKNQMEYLQTIIDDDGSTNFRKKLNRLDIENIEKEHHK